MTYEELINLLREYFNHCDAWRYNKFDKTQFTHERLMPSRTFEVEETLRNLVLTEKDKRLIAKAEAELNIANYWDGDKLKEKCDTTSAWTKIDRIMIHLYRREEAKNEME